MIIYRYSGKTILQYINLNDEVVVIIVVCFIQCVLHPRGSLHSPPKITIHYAIFWKRKTSLFANLLRYYDVP